MLAELRATLRDPFYRHECRQARKGNIAMAVLAVVLALAGLGGAAFLGSAVLFPLVAAIAAFMVVNSLWCAESLFSEKDRDTLLGLVLTPADRARIVRAKVLARVRPVAWVAAACVPLGAAVGWFDAWPGALAGTCLGVGLGLMAGIHLVCSAANCGAFAMLETVRRRSRLTGSPFALFWCLMLQVAEAALLTIVVMPVIGAAMLVGWILWERQAIEETLALASLPAILMGLLTKCLLVNRYSTRGLIDGVAARMDELVLDDR